MDRNTNEILPEKRYKTGEIEIHALGCLCHNRMAVSSNL